MTPGVLSVMTDDGVSLAVIDVTHSAFAVAANDAELEAMSHLKVGPDNLGTEASPLDRRIAASFPALVTRLRLQDMARLLADGLWPALAARRQPLLALVNIGGGPGGRQLERADPSSRRAP
jgi:hypothetical protein